MNALPKRRSHAFTTLLVVLLCACAGAGCKQSGLPDPSSETYREVVSSFYTGLAALEIGETERAEDRLTQVTKRAPKEPAAWANLGILSMRRNAFEEAQKRMSKARELAPDDAHLYYLLGLLARRRGNFQQAIERLERATELDSSNVRAMYTLVEVIERQNAQNETGRVQRLLDRILAREPGNLVVLLEQARLASNNMETDVLRKKIRQLTDQSDGWPQEVRDQLDKVRKAAKQPNLDQAAAQITFLKNVLKRVPAYGADRAAVKSPASQVGEPITRFLRLPAPSPRPAPPDDSLTFSARPLAPTTDSDPASWMGAMTLTTDQLPQVVRATGSQVEVDTTASMPFPGGAAAAPPSPHGIAALDYNYDFRRDLVFAGRGGLRVFRNDTSGAFTDVTGQLGLPASITGAAYMGVWPADLDQEGDVDLVLATPDGPPRVLRNDGDGTFSRWSLFGEAGSSLRDVAWADLSGDGDPDAAFLDDAGSLRVLENRRSGAFHDVTLPAQIGETHAIDAADVNRDGIIDLLALQSDGTVQRLSYQPERETWSADTLARWPQRADLLDSANARLFAADLDNNGGLDLVVSTPAGGRVLLSDAQDQFSAKLGSTFEARVFSIADLDGDGRLDLVGFSKNRKPVRLESKGAKSYHAVSFRPRARRTYGDRRINPFGLGGEITVRDGLLYQKQPITDPIVHFGLGAHDRADVARIVWPNGTVQAEFGVASDQVVTAQQRLKGSCPWLFAYDGQEMGFVTDLLWSTSMGLRINAQGTADVLHSIDWVKIRGDELTPRNDFYDLRITAELWESHFFDSVTLMTVDHPEKTDIFVDERFLLPPKKPSVQVMHPPQPIAHAWDSEGREVTEVVQKKDGQHLASFDLGAYQGLAEDHYVEVELGEDAPRKGPLWLLASGWVYPTDTSINLALSQGKRARPKGLGLEVPNGAGGWKVVRPDMGFPAGKKKTMLIDLTDVFVPGAPQRLRLRTNAEVYWDRLAWAKGQPDAGVKMQRLSANASDLRYRGFSVTRKPRRSAPEVPDYEIASTTQRWRDLIGYYTRFGDVRELTRATDDRYVIMDAGDELALRFEAPPPPPEGWERDFVLISDGWIKDGDYNTGYSKTLRPLPYHGLHDYAQPPAPLEQDPAYRRHPGDWKTYHTRYVRPRRFRTALLPEEKKAAHR